MAAWPDPPAYARTQYTAGAAYSVSTGNVAASQRFGAEEENQAYQTTHYMPLNYATSTVDCSMYTSQWPTSVEPFSLMPYAPQQPAGTTNTSHPSLSYGESFSSWSTAGDSSYYDGHYAKNDLSRSGSSLSRSESYESYSTVSTPRHATPIHPEQPSTSAPGQTNIDSLMLAIQSSTNSLDARTTRSCSPQGRPKKHHCPYAQCDKAFSQRTHLHIHIRAHTNEKPYTCGSCGHRFSQLGNLKTHERRHTGDRPYECHFEDCGKRFAQRSNLRSHIGTVHGTPLINSEEDISSHHQAFLTTTKTTYQCHLDTCSGKAFTQLGNLKAHQNKFHADTLHNLEQRFASLVTSTGSAEAALNQMNLEERHLWEYFSTLYRNSNKGIKGRGKGRKVGIESGGRGKMDRIP